MRRHGASARLRSAMRGSCKKSSLSSPGLTGRPSIPETVISNSIGRGVLDRPPSRAMTTEVMALYLKTHVHILAAHSHPSSAIRFTLFKPRAQGRPGARRPHGPRAEKKHAAEPQVRPRHPSLPCAMALRLIRDLPGDRLSCPRRPRARRVADLTSAPGGQDHTISPCASRCSSAW
jgi:hypothetical protein